MRLDHDLATTIQFANLPCFEDGVLRVLNRQYYPLRQEFIQCKNPDEVAKALETRFTDGLSAILAGAWTLVMVAHQNADLGSQEQKTQLERAASLVAGARSGLTMTMNLTLKPLLQEAFVAIDRGLSVEDSLRSMISDRCQATYEEADKIGQRMAELTPDYGNILIHSSEALYPAMLIRHILQQKKDINIYIPEQRPTCQGSRLVATAIQEMGGQVTVIPDTAVAYIMKRKRVQTLFTCADLLYTDTFAVTPIGGFQYAMAAKYWGIPHYLIGRVEEGSIKSSVLALEEFPAKEATEIYGEAITSKDVLGYAPAHDVMPPELCDAFILPESTYRLTDLIASFVERGFLDASISIGKDIPTTGRLEDLEALGTYRQEQIAQDRADRLARLGQEAEQRDSLEEEPGLPPEEETVGEDHTAAENNPSLESIPTKENMPKDSTPTFDENPESKESPDLANTPEEASFFTDSEETDTETLLEDSVDAPDEQAEHENQCEQPDTDLTALDQVRGGDSLSAYHDDQASPQDLPEEITFLEKPSELITAGSVSSEESDSLKESESADLVSSSESAEDSLPKSDSEEKISESGEKLVSFDEKSAKIKEVAGGEPGQSDDGLNAADESGLPEDTDGSTDEEPGEERADEDLVSANAGPADDDSITIENAASIETEVGTEPEDPNQVQETLEESREAKQNMKNDDLANFFNVPGENTPNPTSNDEFFDSRLNPSAGEGTQASGQDQDTDAFFQPAQNNSDNDSFFRPVGKEESGASSSAGDLDQEAMVKSYEDQASFFGPIGGESKKKEEEEVDPFAASSASSSSDAFFQAPSGDNDSFFQAPSPASQADPFQRTPSPVAPVASSQSDDEPALIFSDGRKIYSYDDLQPSVSKQLQKLKAPLKDLDVRMVESMEREAVLAMVQQKSGQEGDADAEEKPRRPIQDIPGVKKAHVKVNVSQLDNHAYVPSQDDFAKAREQLEMMANEAIAKTPKRIIMKAKEEEDRVLNIDTEELNKPLRTPTPPASSNVVVDIGLGAQNLGTQAMERLQQTFQHATPPAPSSPAPSSFSPSWPPSTPSNPPQQEEKGLRSFIPSGGQNSSRRGIFGSIFSGGRDRQEDTKHSAPTNPAPAPSVPPVQPWQAGPAANAEGNSSPRPNITYDQEAEDIPAWQLSMLQKTQDIDEE